MAFATGRSDSPDRKDGRPTERAPHRRQAWALPAAARFEVLDEFGGQRKMAPHVFSQGFHGATVLLDAFKSPSSEESGERVEVSVQCGESIIGREERRYRWPVVSHRDVCLRLYEVGDIGALREAPNAGAPANQRGREERYSQRDLDIAVADSVLFNFVRARVGRPDFQEHGNRPPHQRCGGRSFGGSTPLYLWTQTAQIDGHAIARAVPESGINDAAHSVYGQ